MARWKEYDEDGIDGPWERAMEEDCNERPTSAEPAPEPKPAPVHTRRLWPSNNYGKAVTDV